MDFNCVCWGMGEKHVEDRNNNDRLFAWPCPFGCKPGGNAFIKSNVSIERVMKKSEKLFAKLTKSLP